MRATVALIVLLCSCFAQDEVEFDYELDLYYSNTSLFLDLDRARDCVDASNMREYEIYSTLLQHTFSPNIFLLEAAIHPMPIGGLYFRANHEPLYTQGEIDNFNLIRAITAGFEEPYSLSFFLGNMMIFNPNKRTHIGNNRAYLGYLLSVGDYTIKDNRAYYGYWGTFEVKLKGTRHLQKQQLDYSFRVGTRLQANHEFSNIIYLGARRSRVDFTKPILSLFYNSAYTLYVAVDDEHYNLVQAELSVEKKWPLDWKTQMTFGLEVGYLYNSTARYKGSLREEGTNSEQFIIRPNLTF